MTMQRLSVDHSVIPQSLLPLIKAHLRVDHDRDDALISTYIASAIGLIERKCNVSLDPAEYLCSSDELAPATLALRQWPRATAWTLPVNNVRTVTIDDGQEPPGDYSDEFDVWNPDFGGNGSSFLMSRSAMVPSYGWTFTIEVGLDDPDLLAPAFFALIARMTGGLYENREASVALWDSTWDSELMGLWRPFS